MISQPAYDVPFGNDAGDRLIVFAHHQGADALELELWDDLGRRLNHMGGNSGPRFLRMAGKDTFVLSDDVVRALQRWEDLSGLPKGKAARVRAQAAFNRWAEESGRPLCQISMTLACSVD